MKDYKFKKYILFWFSQSVSQLGSAMTSYSLTIWAYTQTNSAMSISLLTFFYYIPYIIVSLFSGSFADRRNKKKILLWSDSISCMCTLFIWILLTKGKMQLILLYLVNGMLGGMNAFFSPAKEVAVSLMVSGEKYTKVSGMNSFSASMQSVFAPVIATFISAYWGLKGILTIDMLSFLFAFFILWFRIDIPETDKSHESLNKGLMASCKEGITFIKGQKGLRYLILSMATFNSLSRLTYENILPAMILARSGGNVKVLGFVSGILGFGGIISGLYATLFKLPKDARKIIYISAAMSFLFGDIFMGIGSNVWIWSIAAIAASTPITFIAAGQNIILYQAIPKDKRGRVFAVRNAIQFSTIPIGILLGGFLADYVFEPFMLSGNKFAAFLQIFTGDGAGSGMGTMFLITGLFGFITSIVWYKNKDIKDLADSIKNN